MFGHVVILDEVLFCKLSHSTSYMNLSDMVRICLPLRGQNHIIHAVELKSSIMSSTLRDFIPSLHGAHDRRHAYYIRAVIEDSIKCVLKPFLRPLGSLYRWTKKDDLKNEIKKAVEKSTATHG